jgi:photosystem II stability/assembly factor-like uncharacterized protein
MNKKRVIITTGLVLLFFLLVGFKAKDIQGNRAFSAVSVACSSDGKIVYLADLEGLYKSEDGGKIWNKVELDK